MKAAGRRITPPVVLTGKNRFVVSFFYYGKIPNARPVSRATFVAFRDFGCILIEYERGTG
jgi:hypothetical protein